MKKGHKRLKTIALTILVILIIFLGYLINRYLIKKVDRQVNADPIEEGTNENYEATENTYKSEAGKLITNIKYQEKEKKKSHIL